MKKYACLILLLICYLSLHKEHLALYTGDSSQPYQVLPYHVSLYPKLDQEALKDGIPFHNQAELTALLEDYLS